MAIVLKDRVKETTSTTGTSDFVLGGASSGYDTFSVIGPNNYTYYCCYDQATGDWEVGVGQYTTTAGGTLVRDTILDNSAATTSKIAFAAGPKDVFITYPAKKAIYEEPSGNTLIDGGPLTVIGTGVPGYTSFSAVLAEMYGNVNSFAQSYARNLSDGSEASADMIVYRDNTVSDSANFLDMGINSSNFSSLTWPIFTAGSMYLYGDGGEMFVGSGTDDLIFFTGGVTPADEAARFDKLTKELTTTASINITGDVNAQGGSFTAPVLTTSTSVLSPANNEFVTKSYVDNASSTGIHIHTPCTSETSAALSAVYVQGGTTFNITDITGTNTVVTSTTHGLSVNDEIWLTTTAGNGLSTNTAYFVYATPTTTSLQLSVSYSGPLLTGLTNASGLSYATRANSGVGAYLEASANEALPVAGVIVGDRVLVYQQATGYWNGIYTVTALGAADPGGSKWKLTRATDANKYEPQNTTGLGEGDYFFIQSNSESYVLTTPGAIIIGYTDLTYTLFSSVPAYTVNSPLQLVGNVLSLTTVPATLGGTGAATVTTGDLLYGSGTNAWSKLGIGTAYRSLVVNGSGTNVEWNAVALNQPGAVSGALPATNGGTGQNAYATGDMLYSDATNSLAKLSGNTTTTKKFLGQVGTGSASSAPVWEQPAASDITGLAASATTDTTNASNISSGTLPSGRLSGSYTGVTGVGTLTAGTWNANTIGATYGGTGFSSYTVGDILYADTGTSLAALADVAVGNALISGGVASAPSWGKIGLATHVSGTLPITSGGTGSTSTTYCSLTTNVTGTLPVGNGGTGLATATGVLVGSGSSITAVAAGTTGNLLTSNGTTWVSSPAPSGMVYPSAGIPNSTGSSWGTSYSTSGSGTVVALVDSPSFTTPALGTPSAGDFSTGTFTWPTFNQNTTGSAGSVANALTNGAYITSSGTYDGSVARTFAVDATDANTASKVVARDASGNFSAGTITAALNGNASTATSATSATTATNVAGGLANQIPYQTGPGATSFIAAPTTASTSLTWNGSAFTWASAGGGVTISNDTTTNATYYPAFMTANSGSSAGVTVSSTKLTYNPSTGVLSATTHTSSSDETLKTNWRALPENFVPELAKVKHGIFDRIEEGTTEVGVSAQSLKQILEHAVVAGQDGLLSVNYGGAALVACIQLAEYVTKQEARIAALEQQLALKEIK